MMMSKHNYNSEAKIRFAKDQEENNEILKGKNVFLPLQGIKLGPPG